MGKIKILHIIHGLNLGGAESFIYNVIGLLGSDKYQFDFAIQNPNIGHKKLEELIKKLGGTIYVIPDFRKNPVGEITELRKILALGYDYVHIHMNALINPIPVFVSSAYKNQVIIHSHNTSCEGGIIGKILHKIHSRILIRNRFIRIACGTDAGKWMFRDDDFKVVSNAIDLKLYQYSQSTRQIIRTHYNLSDEFVIGQVGRLNEIKNQRFSLYMLKAYIDKYPDEKVRLMLVGKGPMDSELKELAHKLEIEDKTIFTGGVSNPYDYYSSFDCMILPSLYEGLAFVAVEAQGAGLKVIASDNNTSEINLTGDVVFHSLNDLESWLESIHNCVGGYNRITISDKLKGSKYDNNSLKEIMSRMYL